MNLSVNLLLILVRSSLVSPVLSINIKYYVDVSIRQWTASEGRLIGGHEASPHSHPYLVSLQTRFLWVRMHICGGALLSENWILSAGHCIKESWLIRWLPMDAVAGTHDVNNYDSTAQVINIAKRISHPQYSGGIGPYDIGMLRTRTPFTLSKQIQPIHLPVDSDLRQESLTLTGWGVLKTTMFIPDLPSKLQEVQVTYIPYDDCFKALEDINEDGENNSLDKNAHICTGPLSGGVAACNGDSGGPLIAYISYSNAQVLKNLEVSNDSSNYNDENYENTKGGEDKKRLAKEGIPGELIPIVLGVVSWGIAPCGEKGAPTVYTNVSSYLDFIYQHIYE